MNRFIKQAFEASEIQWNSDLLTDIRNSRFSQLIKHCIKNVPYYQKHFPNICPDNITTDDIKRFPIIHKEEIKSNFFELIAEGTDLKRCMRNRTSGSSGNPLVTLLETEIHNDVFNISSFRQRQSWGIHLLDNMLMLIPSHFRKKGFIYPDSYLDTYHLSHVWQVHPGEENQYALDVMETIKPDIIYANPSLLRMFANELEQEISKLRTYPRYIISSFELLDEASRLRYQNLFHCPICNVYGLSEIGDVAWECYEKRKIHINDDYLILEVVDGKNNPVYDQIGHIVVTSLYNYPMPIVRYKTGDMGIITKDKCSCGRQTSVLSTVLGRSVDFFKLASGKLVSPYELMNLFNVTCINRYKFIQKDIRHFDFVYEKTLNDKIKTQMMKKLQTLLGNDIEIRFSQVDSMDRIYGRSDKIKTIENECGENERTNRIEHYSSNL